MSVSVYKNNECKYSIDKLEKVVYLINEEALRNIHIDDGEAYITDIDQEPMSLSVYDIELLDADELDERYKFTHTLKFSMNGYVNYRDFEGRYYAIVKTVDGEYWLVNPLFPCKVTYTYTLNSNDSHTDFTLATISNHPTLRIHGMEHATPYECGYRRCTFKSLRLNETIYSLVTGNHVLYTNDGFKDIEYNKNSAVFTETFDGNNVQHKLDFNIKFDNYKDSWHYNLLEFTENRYAAIIETSCNKFILTGFHFGLQPSFNVTANDDMTMDNIQISLVDMHDNGWFLSYQDEITVEKDGSTNWVYTNKYNGYECIGNNLARYLLMEEVDALMNPTGNYMCLIGYEEQFSFLNIVGTFTDTETFNSYDCADTCKFQSSFPLEFTFNLATCREYDLMCDGDWSISSSAAHITVSPSSGTARVPYTVEICNTLTPTSAAVQSTLTVEYCNKSKTYNVIVKKGDDCLPAGSVFDISANGQYVTIPTSCCVSDALDFSGIITNITIQNSYIRVYVPQNNTNEPRQFIISITYCDGNDGEAIINQGTGFERWVKEDTACTGNQKCDVERKYTGTTIDNINTRTEETRYTNCVTSTDCSGISTRWIDTSEKTCSGEKKYIVQKEQQTVDGGETWTDTSNKRLGDEIPSESGDCAGVEEYEEWRENGTICDDTTKYNRLQLFVSIDQVNWYATNVYKKGDRVIETNSADCGYIIPSTGWTCDKWETADGYICEGTTKYAREQWYIRNCSDCNNCGTEWIPTGVYRRTNTVLETNSVDCGYIKGSDEWTCEKWEVVDGDYICEDGTKYTKERRYVRECEDCSDCSTPWVATDAYRRGSTILEVNSIDCGYIIPSTAYTWDDWRVVDNDYICEDGDKYEKLRRWVSNDQVSTKSEVVHWIPTDVYKRGQLIETNSTDCGYNPILTGNCTEYRDEGDTICDGFDKYKYLRKYVRNCTDCSNCSAAWVATNIYKRGDLIQSNSTDCGYVKGSDEWTCEKWDVADGYICEETTKYAREQRYVRDCENCNSCTAEWIPTGVYRRTNTVLETNSADCGYVKPSTAWTCSKWEVVQNDYICEDGTKYTKERRYVRECEDCSDCSAPWIPTDVYRRGSTVLEENSTDCGYDPTVTGNCTEYRDEGDTICDGFDKYKYLRKYVRECEDCSDCSASWQQTNIYKRGALVQANSVDCGYIPSDTYERWVEDGYMCDGYSKYKRLIKEISEDNVQWYRTSIYKRGTLIENNSTDCGYNQAVTGNCSEYRDEGDTICNEYNKYKYLRKYVRFCENCNDCSASWMATNIYKRGTLIQANSIDCGYIPTDTYTEWRVEGTMCNGYNLYYRERKYISDDGNNWYQTNIYKQGSLIEEKSLDCGYTPPHPSWFWEDWRIVETDFICEDGDKYEKLRRWVSNDQVSTKEEVVNWIPTDVYKRGQLLESDSQECGYDPTLSGNCTEYRDDGDTICDGFDKYKYLRKYVRECEDCSDCSATWQQTNIYKRGDKIQEHSIDCGYIPSDSYYEWREIGWECNGYDKYKKYRKYISDDGNNWYATNIYKLGDSPIESNSVDCGYVERVRYEYRWVESDYAKCVGTTKYYTYKKQRRRILLGAEWEDVVPTVYSIDADGTMQPRVAEVDSPDCGYVPPVEPRYRWVTMDINRYWICADCDDTPDELPKIEWRINDPEATVQSALCDDNASLDRSDYNDADIVYAKIGGCVTTIEQGCFSGKTNLSEVLIPSTVTTIGNAAFSGCTGLIDFSLPMTVTSIGASAFTNDIQLNKIMLPNSITSIGDCAFSGCKNFPSINIPDGITIIPTKCFYDCDGMTDIYLPENVRLIQSQAFANCNGLVNFTCYAVEPPSIYQDTFSNMNENLKIYVPAASVNAYKLAWSAYADNIVAIGE